MGILQIDEIPRPLCHVASWGLCLAMMGCGGGNSNSNTQVTTVQAVQPVQPGPAAPVQPAPVPAGVAAAVKKSPVAPTRSPRSKLADPFAETDPKNLFEIAEDAPVDQVLVEDTVAAENRFIVGEFTEGTDSSVFVGLQPETGTGASSGRGAAEFTRNAEFKLPEGFVELTPFGYSKDGLPLRIRDEKTGGQMALVPGGLARIGSVDGPEPTMPPFTPFLETFYMDVTEVTLGEYAQFRDDVKEKKSSRVQPPLNDGKAAEQPALGVPWGIAQGFAHWAGKELPTEAEFEKAARGPDGFRTPWGDGRAVWGELRTQETITVVAAYRTDQSQYGIYDLAGNAREWCSDWYSESAHHDAAKAPERTLRNWAGPKKPSVSGQRVVKGNGPDWSAWHREGRNMADRSPEIGFRCVLRVKVPSPTDSNGD